MRFELFLSIAALLVVLVVWCIRLCRRREVLIHLLFTFAVISYLFRHLTGSRTV
jgi:hypothetical protein